MKLLMRDEAKGREHTIFVTIFSALMVMLAIVVMLMASATAISGVTLQLDENAVDILDKQVENRAGYIQDQLQQAQELTDLSTYINETAQQMLDDETLSLKTLDSSSSDSLPLLQAAAPRMLETLRSKRITGIFLILNTHDFTGRTSGDRLPCVYLRDLDPDAAPSVVNSDILLECAPSELVQTFDIATDKAWSPALQYLDGEQDVFYVRPFQTAYEDVERIGAANYGRWTTLPYKLLGDDREAIAYAQPLILDDGTVYGVLGVELLESYMDTKLPWNELQNDHHGSYLLASTTSDLKGEVLDLHVTSNTGEQNVPLRNAKWELTLRRSNNYWYYMMDGKQQIASIRQISLYSRNAPFSGERWLLVGVVGKNDLFSFSQSVTKLLGLAVLLTMGIGLACAFLVSFGLAQPVAQLSKELVDAQEQRKAVPEFSRTGIRELDQLAESIVTLSTDNYKAAVAERNRIEHERDYDALTGLYSRQAFFRVCGELFEKPDTLRHAALMMTDLDTLKKYADFAMYEVKHSTKGEIREFDMERYRVGVYAMEQRSDFEKLIRERRVDYDFQPIVSAHDGHVVAYEALMRPQLPTLRSPLTVMQLASEMGRMYDIEKLTLFRACECYEELKAAGKLDADALIFVNSIASVSLSDEDWASYCEAHSATLPKLVVEITEEEEMNERELERKRDFLGSPGAFALDDYGSGYSNGNSLLTVAPKYVKVDIAIIRGIDTDADKQQFLKTLIDYARPRGIYVLAEGVETLSELRKVLEMGVDLLQGYCLACPAAEPVAIDEKAVQVIREAAQKRIEQEEAWS